MFRLSNLLKMSGNYSGKDCCYCVLKKSINEDKLLVKPGLI